jgi:hypothetical protein
MESAAREGAHGFELDITLCKRPRESWIILTLHKPRSQSPTAEKSDQKKMVLDFKQKIQPDVVTRHSLNVSCFDVFVLNAQFRTARCGEGALTVFRTIEIYANKAQLKTKVLEMSLCFRLPTAIGLPPHLSLSTTNAPYFDELRFG